MADDNNDKTIFQKISETLSSSLDASQMAMQQYITKARSEIAEQEDTAFYRKSMYRDPSYSIGAQGWQEKANRLSYTYLYQMSKKNTIVAAIIQTYQNKVAAHSKPAKDPYDKGFRIKLKNEQEALDKIKEELFPNSYRKKKDPPKKIIDKTEYNRKIAVDNSDEISDSENAPDPTTAQDEADDNDDGNLTDKEMERYARQELYRRTKEKINAIQEMVLNCGSLENRPFESMRWNFDAFLRALVRDTCTYDQIATEMVYDQKGEPHHWVPADGGTIRYTTPALKDHKNVDMFQSGYDLLFPEKELKAMEQQRDALELDEEKLEQGDYKWAQVIRGKLVRAFTPDELFVGMRNPTTDVYSNGYSISELELLMNIVSSHIYTENYNKSYFTQGFSAKGILHIKAPLNRRKLESIRTQWQHMVKGNKNSFQTPIMSGMDEVKWIPLTQSHSDMEFSKWMNYLIKVVCSIYQIDPLEIGFGMKEEGGSGGSLSGDNTQEKLDASRTKGLEPMLRFFEDYLNRNIIDKIDPDYELEFVGISEEDKQSAVDRQSKEVTFKKSVNEIRQEDNLPPIAGADDLILDQNYFQWFMQFHPDGQKMQEEQNADQQIQGVSESVENQEDKNTDEASNQIAQEEQGMQAEDQTAEEEVGNLQEENSGQEVQKSLSSNKPKKIAIEYYTFNE